MNNYKYHTVEAEHEGHKIIGTQKHTVVDKTKYYLPSFMFTIFKGKHIIAQGEIMGGGVEKLTKEILIQTKINRKNLGGI